MGADSESSDGGGDGFDLVARLVDRRARRAPFGNDLCENAWLARARQTHAKRPAALGRSRFTHALGLRPGQTFKRCRRPFHSNFTYTHHTPPHSHQKQQQQQTMGVVANYVADQRKLLLHVWYVLDHIFFIRARSDGPTLTPRMYPHTYVGMPSWPSRSFSSWPRSRSPLSATS